MLETIFLLVMGVIATFGIFLALSIGVFMLRIIVEYLFDD